MKFVKLVSQSYVPFVPFVRSAALHQTTAIFGQLQSTTPNYTKINFKKIRSRDGKADLIGVKRTY